MFSKVTIFVCVFFHRIYAVEIATRIVNGTDAERDEFPEVVSLRTHGSHTCGGTILNDRFILTAAHCVPCGKSPYGMSIQYGSRRISSGGHRSIDVGKINCNGDYDSKKMTSDIAILELTRPIPPGNWKPVTIAKSYDGRYPQVGVIVGWGRLSTTGPGPKILQKAMVNVYSDRTCAKTNHELKHHVCVGAPNVGACFGDSGTALFVNGVQVGIASYISHDECGVSDEFHPNIYSRVATYYPWIAKVIGPYESNLYNPYPGNPGVYNSYPTTAGSYGGIPYNPNPYAGSLTNNHPDSSYNFHHNFPVNQYPSGGPYNPYNPYHYYDLGGGLVNPYNFQH